MRSIITRIWLPPGNLGHATVCELLRLVLKEYKWFQPKRYGSVSLKEKMSSRQRDIEAAVAYYEENKKSVAKITRFDIFNLQYKLPRTWLQVPYDIANRLSRVLAAKSNATLVSDIQVSDYFLSDKPADSLDFFYIGSIFITNKSCQSNYRSD